MSADLGQILRNMLTRIKQQLDTEQFVERSAQQPSMQELQRWCDRYELDTRRWCVGKTVRFDRAVLHSIEHILAEMGLADLTVDNRQKTRVEQSDSSHNEVKHLGLAPTERRVLIAQANCGAYFPEWVTAAPSQWVMDIDWQTVQLSAFAYVVVVENRDMFYQYFALHPQRYVLPDLALNALVIYRGDGDESKGCKALRAACLALGKPVVYFGDYDNAGLNFAINGGYSHIMLPLEAYLLAQANDLSQDNKQIELAASVIAFGKQLAEDDPLKVALLHNGQKQKGLRQQAFKGELRLLAINHPPV